MNNLEQMRDRKMKHYNSRKYALLMVMTCKKFVRLWIKRWTQEQDMVSAGNFNLLGLGVAPLQANHIIW